MKKTPKNIAWAKKHGARMLPYRDLPLPHQYAIAHYMAIDGEAWEWPDENGANFDMGKRTAKDFERYDQYMKRTLKRKIQFFIDKYGNTKFGIIDIPSVEVYKRMFKLDKDIHHSFDNFEEYHKWYIKNDGPAETTRHRRTNRWPCIISGFDDELFQDGWHRFHTYIRRKDPTIPCIFYS